MQVKVDYSHVLDNFPALSTKIRQLLRDAMIETALADVESPAKRQCRVDTGRLRTSIHTEYYGSYGDLSERPPNELTVHVGTNVEYAVYVERRYPFLFPALESSGGKFRKRLESALAKI
jgi:hypothetical protein